MKTYKTFPAYMMSNNKNNPRLLTMIKKSLVFLPILY